MIAARLMLIAIVANGLYGELAHAQPTADMSINGSEQPNRTAEVVLKEIETRELELYEIFNARNSSNEFDIACSSRPDAPPNNSRQVCEPVLLAPN